MNNSDDASALLGLILLPFAIIIALGYVLGLLGLVALFLGFWLIVGVAANLSVRFFVGLVGDAQGASPLVADLGLATILLAPFTALAAFALLTLATLNADYSVISSLGVLVLLFSFLWMPGYYWAYFAREVPWLHWKLELPFKTEAAMRAQEAIIRAKIVAIFSTIELRWKIWLLEHGVHEPRDSRVQAEATLTNK